MNCPQNTLAAWTISLLSAACTAPVPAPPELAVVAKDSGTAFSPELPVLKIQGERLILHSGTPCPERAPCPILADSLPPTPSPVVLDIPADAIAAQLRKPLGILADARPDIAFRDVCLRVSAGGESRCLGAMLRPESSIAGWLGSMESPAKIRLVVRQSGMEVVTIHGKIPGPDRYGPSIPAVGGVHDFGLLAKDMAMLSAKFPDEREVVLLLSPQTPFQTAVLTMDTAQKASGGQFSRFILAY